MKKNILIYKCIITVMILHGENKSISATEFPAAYKE